MKVLIEIGHPAHVHQFKHMIWALEEHGHVVKIVAKYKEITQYLLNIYGFAHENIGKDYKGTTRKASGSMMSSYRILKIARKFMPDIFISRGSISVSIVSQLFNRPHIVFGDTEIVRTNKIATYLWDVILTPTCFKDDLGKKHIRYNGYHELAYLHPNYFKPNANVLDSLGLSKDDRLILLRFSSMDAQHDIGVRGLNLASDLDRLKFIKELEIYGKVFLTSEIKLSKEFEKYKIKIPPEHVHNLLSVATMYIGDGATMASEAGVLGTPWIFVSNKSRGYLDDQEKNYGLGFVIPDTKLAIKKAIELFENDNLKLEWQRKRRILFNEKIDVTKFMVGFIEDYPESFERLKSRNLMTKNEY